LIGIIGNEFFGRRVVKALETKIDATLIYPSLHDLRFKNKIKKIDIIHFIGSPTVSTHGILTLLRFRSWNKKVIVHWIGGDAWLATNKIIQRYYTILFKNKINLHLAIEDRLSKMLSTIGLDSIEIPLPVAKFFDVMSLPTKNQVIVYAPDESEYFWRRFNGPIIKKLVKEFPDIVFVILRNSGKYFNEPNVRCFSWVENMEELYKSSIAVIRISTHDGLPTTIMEALSMGRQFIYSEPFPFCKTAKSFEEAKILLREILEKPTINLEGSKYVREKYDSNKIADKLVEIYNNL